MFADDDEDALLKRHRYVLQEIEREIRKINREVIHRDIARIERSDITDLARVVAEHRARYLQAGMRLAKASVGSPEEQEMVRALPDLRREFESTRDVFAALERAIEQAYVDIELR
jgi:tRNA(Ile2) C34 agmatinyltransferase TiaS